MIGYFEASVGHSMPSGGPLKSLFGSIFDLCWVSFSGSGSGWDLGGNHFLLDNVEVIPVCVLEHSHATIWVPFGVPLGVFVVLVGPFSFVTSNAL